VILQVTGVSDGQILSLDNFPSSSEYDIAKPVSFYEVIDEFSSVKVNIYIFTIYIFIYIVNLQLYMKNLNELYVMLRLYTVNKLKF
jgi:hypothetical protein